MASRGLIARSSWFALAFSRPFSASSFRRVDLNERANDTAEQWRKHQTEKPLNPHITNTNSTIANEMPSLGREGPPPEMISSADPGYNPKDSVPENTERMAGGTQNPAPESGVNKELEVGELAGASFRVEPKRRTGEDLNTLRARLLYQCRKRGTLESDLLLSTFADANLGTMSHNQLLQFDQFLDENDWDIYYWATQQPTPSSIEYAEGGGPDQAISAVQGTNARPRPTGEWAQTVGAFKPAYRPVPSRWKNSETLAILRKHVKDRSAGGVRDVPVGVEGKGLNQSAQGTRGGGLGFMPPIRNFDS